MRISSSVLTRSAVWALFTFLLCASASAYDINEQFTLDPVPRQQMLLKKLATFELPPADDEAASRTIPQDDWAYIAARQLSETGLLGETGRDLFEQNRPITALELSQAVSEMAYNYSRYSEAGSIVFEPEVGQTKLSPARNLGPAPGETATATEDISPVVRLSKRQAIPPPPLSPVKAPPPGSMLLQPPSPEIVRTAGNLKNRGMAVFQDAASTGTAVAANTDKQSKTDVAAPDATQANADKKEVKEDKKDAGKEADKKETAEGGDTEKKEDKAADKKAAASKDKKDTKATADKTATKDKTAAKDAKGAEKKPAAKKVKLPKELAKLEKDVELTDKDLQILDSLINYVEKDVIKGKVSKDISEVKKLGQKNERDIEKLEEQAQRFRITGEGSAGYERNTKETYANDSDASGTPWKSLSTNLYSKPRKFDDMTLRSAMTSSGDMNLTYQDYTVDKKHPRNFKLRSIWGGRGSFGASPLTSLGTGLDGFGTELLLNDFSLGMGIGTSTSDGNIFIDGATVRSTIFGEPSSWLYVTHFQSYNKRNHTYDLSQKWGYWDTNWGDSGKPGSARKPPEKNGVSSVYIRYPMPITGMFMTAEYAHSTYYRPGFKLRFVSDAAIKDVKDADCLAQCPFSDKRYCPCQKYDDWDGYCADLDVSMNNIYKTWIPIPELEQQDDAYLLLFDYNNGPLSIFPMGYARLGPTFVSKFLGLPGFSADSFGISMLPINLQSLELGIIMGSYKKLEDKYKWDFLAVKGKETDPMFLDSSAIANKDMIVILNLNLMTRLNNRRPSDTLDLSYVQNKFTYYLTDNISFTGEFSSVKAALDNTCIDGNTTTGNSITDDYGNIVEAHVGNGIADCDRNSPTFDSEDLEIKLAFSMKTQKYNLYWKTSKKAEFSMDYGFTDSRLAISSNYPALTGPLADKIPQHENFWQEYNFKYRLTDVSGVEVWARQDYADPTEHMMKSDFVRSDKIGIKLNMSY